MTLEILHMKFRKDAKTMIDVELDRVRLKCVGDNFINTDIRMPLQHKILLFQEKKWHMPEIL